MTSSSQTPPTLVTMRRTIFQVGWGILTLNSFFLSIKFNKFSITLNSVRLACALDAIEPRKVAKQSRNPCFGPPTGTQRITGSAFRITFHPDWQIDKGFFYGPINRYIGEGSEQRFRCSCTHGLYQSLLSSVAQANLEQHDKKYQVKVILRREDSVPSRKPATDSYIKTYR